MGDMDLQEIDGHQRTEGDREGVEEGTKGQEKS